LSVIPFLQSLLFSTFLFLHCPASFFVRGTEEHVTMSWHKGITKK
jgi:hypothetical protein